MRAHRPRTVVSRVYTPITAGKYKALIIFILELQHDRINLMTTNKLTIHNGLDTCQARDTSKRVFVQGWMQRSKGRYKQLRDAKALLKDDEMDPLSDASALFSLMGGRGHWATSLAVAFQQ